MREIGFSIDTPRLSDFFGRSVTGQRSYTSANTYNWTVPEGVYSITVVLVGGGGGSGGSYGRGAGSPNGGPSAGRSGTRGAVRILWGSNRSFPTTNVQDIN